MAFRPQALAEKELTEFLQLFAEAVTEGHRRFWKIPGVHVFDPGTRSRMIRDLVVDEMRRAMDGKPKTHILDENQTALFCVDQNWIVQVHKLDPANQIAKNFNQTSMDLRCNRVSETTLPGVPPKATVLFLGYVENLSDPKCPEIRLYCPGEVDEETWMIPLGIAPPEQPEEITPKTPLSDPEEGTRVVAKDQSATRKRHNK
jgi:hypothetical protein